MNERRDDDPTIGPTVIASVVFTVLVVFTVVALVVYFRRHDNREWEAKMASQNLERDRVVAEDQARIESYHWIDEETGTVAIPIEQAMDLVVMERK